MSAPIKRNPHVDFKKVEASRPSWDAQSKLKYIQTAEPSWKTGNGANKLQPDFPAPHISIDPSDPERPSVSNYKLLISAITPRPIAFISSYSPDANDTSNMKADVGNLAPFSYFNVINHDPPLFTVGFASALTQGTVKKDTLANVAATGECVLNIISEGFLEAANSTSVNAPREVDEWILSGLTKVWDCSETPRCPRVAEAVFSVECKVQMIKEFESKREPGNKTGTLVVLEGVRFWVREDAINEDRSLVNPEVLRPVSRLGGITYGRTVEVLELPRPDWGKDVGGEDGLRKAEERMNARKKNDNGGGDVNKMLV